MANRSPDTETARGELQDEYTDAYRSDMPTHNGYGMPRGPIATIPEAAPTVAIGFCPMCGENARKTCSARGAFDCPNCTFWWYDERVGTQKRSLEDFMGSSK